MIDFSPLQNLDNTSELPFLQGPINPLARFCVGLIHDAAHLEQNQEIVRQAKAARSS